MEEIESEVELEPLTPLGLGLQVRKNENPRKSKDRKFTSNLFLNV